MLEFGKSELVDELIWEIESICRDVHYDYISEDEFDESINAIKVILKRYDVTDEEVEERIKNDFFNLQVEDEVYGRDWD